MPTEHPTSSTGSLHSRLTLVLQAVIVLGLVVEVYEQQWMNVAMISGILLLTLLPALLARRLEIFIPPEFEVLTIAFVFAAIFLGEMRGFYQRFWWWDMALHTTSGGLLGIFGFLLVYVLNANPRIELDLRPGFVALFAFCFALAVGSLWEIFEFAMDKLAGFNMQKPMLGDPSGLTDTMWDLIVDALGAVAIAAAGYYYMRHRLESIVEGWIRTFIHRNPRLFTRRLPRGDNSNDDDPPPRAA